LQEIEDESIAKAIRDKVQTFNMAGALYAAAAAGAYGVAAALFGGQH